VYSEVRYSDVLIVSLYGNTDMFGIETLLNYIIQVNPSLHHTFSPRRLSVMPKHVNQHVFLHVHWENREFNSIMNIFH
jgi:hypothetical protein